MSRGNENPFVKRQPITSVDLVYPPRDREKGMTMLVLERVEPGRTPEYCIHGKVTCYACDEWCWLGDETYKLVKGGEAVGICIECATKRFPPEVADRGPVRHVRDHRRADGPH